MFPPTSGREMIPEPEPTPSPEPEDDYQGDYPRPAMSRYSQRFRILAFGILVGGLIAVLFAAVIAFLRSLAGPEYDVFDRWEPMGRQAVPRFLSMFVSELLRAAPVLILVATLAAAAQALIRRTHQEARLTRDLIRSLKPRPESRSESPAKTAADIVRPLRKEMNLELDSLPEP